MTTTTWDSNAESGITLSNGNLTATVSSAAPVGSGSSVRSTTSRTTGKAYVELTMGNVTSGGGTHIGIANSSWDYANSDTLGLDANSFSYDSDGSIFVANSSQPQTAATYIAGDIVQLCVDFDAQLFWVRKNNSGDWNGTAGASPGGSGGIGFGNVSGSCFYVGYYSATSGDNVTVNFGGSPSSHPVPSGFSWWDTETTQTIWDPNAESGMTLSNSNLTAAVTATGTDGMSVRSLTPWNTGKAYIEFSMGQVSSGGNTRIGIANASWNYTRNETLGIHVNLGRDDYSFAYDSDGYIYVAGTQVGLAATFAITDTLQLCVDFGAKVFWVRKNGTGHWNGVMGASPVTGTNGISFSSISGPWFIGYCSATAGDTVTANFGASAFSYTAPTGFSAWSGGYGGGIIRPAALASYPAWKNYQNLTFGSNMGNNIQNLPDWLSQGWVHAHNLCNNASEVQKWNWDMTSANPNVQFPENSNYCDLLATWNGMTIAEAGDGDPNGNVMSMQIELPFNSKHMPLTNVTYVEAWLKCPNTNGAWPAWWTDGHPFPKAPSSSVPSGNSSNVTIWGPEVDFMEIIGPQHIDEFHTCVLVASASDLGKENPNKCFMDNHSSTYNIPIGTADVSQVIYGYPSLNSSNVPLYNLGRFFTAKGYINAGDGYHLWGCLIEPDYTISMWIDGIKIGHYPSTQYCHDDGTEVALNLIITLALSPTAQTGTQTSFRNTAGFGGTNYTGPNNQFRLGIKQVSIWGPKS